MAAYPEVVSVIVGQVLGKVGEPTQPLSGGISNAVRYGDWRVKVERYLVEPQPYQEVTIRLIEQFIRPDGPSLPARFPVTFTPGQRAVLFLSRNLGTAHPSPSGEMFTLRLGLGGQGAHVIREGRVRTVRHGKGGDEPVEDFVRRIVDVARKAGRATEDAESTPTPVWGLPKPPPAVLVIGGKTQTSAIGSYCWSVPGWTNCADAWAIPTPAEPLVVSSPFTAHVRLAVQEQPERLALLVTRIMASDPPPAEGPERWRWWGFQDYERDFRGEQQYQLALDQAPSIELSLDPGLYVWRVFAAWPGPGDVGYGFLVEVRPATSPTPTATTTPMAVATAP